MELDVPITSQSSVWISTQASSDSRRTLVPGVLDPLIRVHSYPEARVLLAVWGLMDPLLYAEQARVVHRVVLRWNRAKVITNIDDLAISIQCHVWALKVIDEVSQIDDI